MEPDQEPLSDNGPPPGLDDIPKLTTKEALDLAKKYDLTKWRPSRTIADVQLSLKLYVLKTLKMFAEGQEPSKILLKIKTEHEEKCRKLAVIFEDCEKMLETLKNENDPLIDDLSKAVDNFSFPQSIQEHVRKLTSNECCKIMVTGELCSGKTTLINNLLGEDFLPTYHLSNTVTFCEIKWGEHRKVVAYPWQKSEPFIILMDTEDSRKMLTEYNIVSTIELMNKEVAKQVLGIKMEVAVVGSGEEGKKGNRGHVNEFLPSTAVDGVPVAVNVAGDDGNWQDEDIDKKTGNTCRQRCEAANEQRVGSPSSEVIGHQASGSNHCPRQFDDIYRDLQAGIRQYNCYLKSCSLSDKPAAVILLTDSIHFRDILAEIVQAKDIGNKDIGRFKKVEVFLPKEVLKGGLTIVDSPGIGDNPQLTQMVVDYTVEAFAFIYVINSKATGGVQEDRLTKLLNEVQSLKTLNDQSMFSRESAIFVCNQWDKISQKDHSRLMTDTVGKLRRCWFEVEESQVVPFSAYEATEAYKFGLLTIEFKNLLNSFENLIPHGLENKIFFSVSWLEGLLQTVERLVVGYLTNIDCDERQRAKNFEIARAKLKHLKELSDRHFKELQKFVDDKVTEAVKVVSEYLKTDEVLNDLAAWKEKDFPVCNIDSWAKLEYLVRRKLEGRVKVKVQNCDQKNQILSKVRPEVLQKFKEWFEGENIYEELYKVQQLVNNKKAQVDVLQQQLPEFSPRRIEGLGLMEKMGRTMGENKLAFGLTSPLWVPFAVVAFVPALMAFGISSIVDYGRERMNLKKLQSYSINPKQTLETETRRIIQEYCKSNGINDYLKELLKPAYDLVEILKDVVPQQVDRENRVINNIANDRRDADNLKKFYPTILESCRAFVKHIQHFQVMNMQKTTRYVKVMAFSDVLLSHAPPVADGWFSVVCSAQLSTEPIWLRKILLNVTVVNVSDYIEEESAMMLQRHRNLPKFLGTSVNEQTMYHLLKDVGQHSLRMRIYQLREDRCHSNGAVIGGCPLAGVVKEFQGFAQQIAEGLHYLHQRRYVCGDLTLDTLTVTDGDVVKLTNIAVHKTLCPDAITILEEDFKSFGGRKARYLPASVLQTNEQYTTLTDIYSFGLLQWEMTSEALAYQDEMDANDVTNMQMFINILLERNIRPVIPNIGADGEMVELWFTLVEKCWEGDGGQEIDILGWMDAWYDYFYPTIDSFEIEDVT